MDLRDRAACLAETSGLNGLLRRLYSEGIVVLMYHGVVPDRVSIDAWTLVQSGNFEKQLRYVSERYEVIALRDAGTNTRGGQGKMRAIITFDDGYRSNYETAFPILRRLKLPATIFLTTRMIDTDRLFWFDKVICAVQANRWSSFDFGDDDIGVVDFAAETAQRRWDKIQSLLTRMKKLDARKRDLLVERISGEAPLSRNQMGPFLPLSWSEIVEMRDSGLVEFGSHTHGHEILTRLPATEVVRTVESSLSALGVALAETVDCLSYPNGEFDSSVINAVRRCGIRLAFTTCNGIWTRDANPHAIPRVGVGGYDSLVVFAAKLSGAFRLATPVAGKGRQG